MLRSGLIFGVVGFILTLASATLISPLCAPCLGLVLGLAAGYVACHFDKPVNSAECIRKGAIAGVIAGGFGFVGGLIGGVINGAIINPTDLQVIYNLFGFSNTYLTKETIWLIQLVGSLCIGLFNLGWMAVLGLAGGVLWYQITRKDQSAVLQPPQEPMPPS